MIKIADFVADRYIFELDAAISDYEAKLKKAEKLVDEFAAKADSASSKVSSSHDKIIKTMDGVNRVYYDASMRGGRWRDTLNGQIVAAEKVTKVTKDMGIAIDGVGRSAGKAEDSIFKFMSPQWVARGIAMGIGWSIMQKAIDAVGAAVTDLFTHNVELESTLVSLRSTAIATGRDYSDILDILNRQTDEFASKTAIAAAMQRLMTTSLSTEQMEEMIERIKWGSISMGYLADEQLPAVARGFKQLNPAILDNIGVNVRLNNIMSRVAEEQRISTNEVTNAMIEQKLFNEVLSQTDKFQAAYGAQLETTRGKVASVRAEWNKLMESLSKTGPLKTASESLATIIRGARILYDVHERQVASEFLPTLIEHQGNLKDAISDLIVTEISEDRIAREREQLREEAIKNFVDENDEIKNLRSSLQELNNERLEASRVIRENEEAIERNNRLISEESFYIRHLQDDLDVINESLSVWTDRQRAAQRAVSDLNAQLERKRKALKPEEYLETETELTQVRSELERAREEEERAMERLLTKRVEPKIFEQYKTEAEEAHQKVIDLEQREAELTTLLEQEISALTQQISAQKQAYADASAEVNRFNHEQQRIIESMESGRQAILNWQEENWHMQVTIEDTRAKLTDELDPAIQELEVSLENATTRLRNIGIEILETGTTAEAASEQVQTLIDKLNNLRDTPDVTKTITINTVLSEFGKTMLKTVLGPVGGLLGEFIPRGHIGISNVPQTGLYSLKKGETVLTEMKGRALNVSTPINVTINAGNRSMRDVFNEIEQISKERTSTYVGGVFKR